MLREVSCCAVFDDGKDCEWLLETEALAYQSIRDESYYIQPSQSSRARIGRIACYRDTSRLHYGRGAFLFRDDEY